MERIQITLRIDDDVILLVRCIYRDSFKYCLKLNEIQMLEKH